ncbi:MAG: hypothetical protein ACTH31_15435, partial [Pseudoclavibacter sp.]
LVGILSAPVADLGRVGEYRQSYRAAAVVLAPVMARARRVEAREVREARGSLDAVDAWRARDARGKRAGLADRNRVEPAPPRPGEHERGRVALAGFRARPGARVLVTGSAAGADRILSLLMGDPATPDDNRGAVGGQGVGVGNGSGGVEGGRARAGCCGAVLDGRRVADLSPRERRARVGVASTGAGFAPGTIVRAARYRAPDTDASVTELLRRVGLAEHVAALPSGMGTRLRRGGEPLDTDARARLKLAAAIADDPELLVLDRIDDELDADGRSLLRGIVARYPGTVIVRSNDPARVVTHDTAWDADLLDGGQSVVPSCRRLPRLRG